VIYFQGSKYGGQYTVNLGFHYAFLNPFFARKRVPLSDYDLLDCALQARLGPFITGRDQWFDYGTDRNSLEMTFEKNAADALKILSRYSKKWRTRGDVWSRRGLKRFQSGLPWDIGSSHTLTS